MNKSDLIYPENYIDKAICGDCMKIMPPMPDNCVPMTLTDIPYGVVTRPDSGLRSLDKGDADVETFNINEFMSEIIRVTAGSIYVFCSSEQISPILTIMKLQGLSIRSCVWEKTNPSPMNGENIWLSGIEHCAYGKKSGSTFNEFCKNSIWRYPAGSSNLHPTEKNLNLFKYLISASSNPGDVVFDPCIGSGTSGEAALSLGRRIIGCEINPEYCAIAMQRIKAELAQPDFFFNSGKGGTNG